jgi:hypothetical protein
MQTVRELREHLNANRRDLARQRPQRLIRMDSSGWKLDRVSPACGIAPTTGGDLALLLPDELYRSVAKRFRDRCCQITGAAPGDPPTFPNHIRGLLARQERTSSVENLRTVLELTAPEGRLRLLSRIETDLPYEITVSPSGYLEVSTPVDVVDHLWHELTQPLRRLLGY